MTYETLKTKLCEVLEKTQELIKEEGKDDTELRDFAARFDRLDTTVQLQQGAVSLETAQLESRAAEEAKDEEATKNELIIGQQAKTRRCFETPGDHDVWETLPEQRSDNEANNVAYLVINGPFRGSSCGTGRATRRWLQP